MPLVVSFAVLVAVIAPEARAQLIDGPVGAIGGLFGGHRPVDQDRFSQSLEVGFDLSGGYDRDPNILFIGAGTDAPDLTRWFASTAAASGRYRVGSLKRSIDARGRTYMNYQSTAGDSLIGGEGVVNAVARFGSRRVNELTLELQSSYEPGWIFGAFGSALGSSQADGSLGVAPPGGVFEQRWLVMAGTAGYQQHWNAKHVTSLEYENRRLEPIDGGGLQSDWQVATIAQTWTVTRRISLLGSYRFDENAQDDADSDPIPPVRYQTVDGGVRYERRLSPVRRYSVTMRGGVTRLVDSSATQDVRSAHPALHGIVEFVPSSRFGLSADYTRGVMVLAGVSTVPVLNDTVELAITGTLSRRLRYSLQASVARAEFLTSDPARSNTTEVTGATAEVRYAPAAWAAAFATYGFYNHRIDDPSLVASGFPTRYGRHSVRVGITFWLPLYGTF